MLEAVRVSTGWTQAVLSLATGVSQTLISQIEAGAREPSDATLSGLASALAVDVALLETSPPAPTIRHAFQKSLPARAVRKLEGDLALAHLRIDRIGGVPEIDVPAWRFDPAEDFGGDRANAVRRAWDVPDGPVDDLVGLMESHGIVCVFRDLADLKVSAVLSTAVGSPTVMFMDSSRSASDVRWAMAHELGHLALREDRDPTIESPADDFAAELLIPRRQLRDSMHEDTTALAAQWGVPHLRLLRYAKESKLISSVTLRRERAGLRPADTARLRGPSWVANAVRKRTRAPGESLSAVAASAFMSVEDLRRDYLAGSRSS